MELGYQTIIWGPWIDNLDEVLEIVSGAGYKGIEFAQRPERLGSINDLVARLKDRGLAFLGLAAGSLQERMEYCGDRVRPRYLYVEDWDPLMAPVAARNGFTLALHPHVCTSIHRLTDAVKLLRMHKELKWLPDTAHLTVAGDDPCEGIRAGKDRLIGVHLKDWTPIYGRSSHRYSRGFTELGRGIVRLDAVLSELKRIGYEGWLIVEQDSTRTDPATSVAESTMWLRQRNLVKPKNKSTDLRPSRHSWLSRSRPISSDPTCELRFLGHIARAAAEETHKCYDTIAKAFAELIPSHLVKVWACSQTSQFMTLLAVEPVSPRIPNAVLDTSKVLSGIAVARHAVTVFDLTDTQPGRRFGYPKAHFAFPELIERMGVKKMITIPILNTYNLNHVRLILNIFPKDDHVPFNEDGLYWLGVDVARAADAALNELCSVAAYSANLLAGQSKLAEGFLEGLASLIRKLVSCEGVSIFLVNQSGDHLELQATTGLEWRVAKAEQFYRKDEGLTGKVWDSHEVVLTEDARKEHGRLGKSFEVVETTRDSCLITPFFSASGKVIGVIRCRNRRVEDLGGANMFSDDDTAIIDAICQVAGPHLDVLLSEERRARAVRKLTHELQTPLIAIRGACQLMRDGFERRKQPVADFFGFDYLGDVWSWSDLMTRLLANAEFYGLKARPAVIRAEPTLLMKEVIAPVVRQVSSLLEARSFSASKIGYGRFEQVPALWIDKNQFQQVIFNLLSNAIKYAYIDPNAFEVVIDGYKTGEYYCVRMRDWGAGLTEGLETAIFDEGVRGPKAEKSSVAGQGLGLWVVRKIVEAHGGTIDVTSLQQPTEFTIFLPESLSRRRHSDRTSEDRF